MATSIRQLHTVDPVERRDSMRRSVAVTRASIQHGESTEDAILLDLSIYGCRLAVDRSPDPGERLWIRIDAGAATVAMVVWAEGGRIGCRFEEPMPGPLLRELIRALS